MGKLIAHIIAILVFVNALATQAATLLTDLATSWPGLSKYAAFSMAVAAFLTPFLPRIQKIGQTLDNLPGSSWGD